MWPNPHLNNLYHREQMEWFEWELQDVTGQRVLDVGCSTGRLSRHLANKGALVTGFDFSERSIDIARAQSAGANPTYRVQSVFDLDEREVYDVITVLGVLAVACRSADDLARALARLYEALKPEGKLLVVEPIHEGLLHRVLDMSLTDFKEVLQAVGFRIGSVTNLHFIPSRVGLAYVAWPSWLTAAGYHIGQRCMKVAGWLNLGDYKAISATRTSRASTLP